MALLGARLYSVECNNPTFVWMDWGKARENAVRIDCVLAEIQTEYIPNSGLDPFRYANSVGKCVCLYLSSTLSFSFLIGSKGKVVPVLTNQVLRHEDVWGSGCIDPRILDLGTSWRWVVSFTHRPLYLRGKSPLYPLDRRLDGPQSRSGRRGEDTNLAPTGTRTPTPGRASRIQSLYRLRYPGSLVFSCNVLTLNNVIMRGCKWMKMM
jgi:hypothetical protein